jgi:hypothetical protein
LGVATLVLGVLLVGAVVAGCGGSATTTTTVRQGASTTASTEAPTTAGAQTPTTAAAGGQLTYGANTLQYAAPVTADQAQKLLDYLVSTFSWDKKSPTGMAFAIAKDSDIYQLAMVVQSGKETDPSILSSAKNLAQDSAKQVFDGAEVDVYLTDAMWNPLAVVKP